MLSPLVKSLLDWYRQRALNNGVRNAYIPTPLFYAYDAELDVMYREVSVFPPTDGPKLLYKDIVVRPEL